MPDERLPALRQAYLPDQDPFSRFRRALRRSDQVILDDLFAAVQKHQAAASVAVNTLPVENILLAMLLEEHKEVTRLRFQLDAQSSSQRDAARKQLKADGE